MVGRPVPIAVRRLIAVGGFVILVVGAAVFAAITDDEQDRAPVAQQEAAAEPTSASTPPEGLPQDGPGLSEPGIFMVAQPMPDSTLKVTEWVITAEPSSTIELDVSDLTSAGGVFAGQTLSASQVTIRIGGVERPPSADMVDGEVSLSLDEPTQVYEITYELAGATVLSQPSSSGRALAVLSPLSTADSSGAPVVIATSGPSVRNLACPASSAPQDPCAEGAPPFLSTNVELSGDTAVVVAQFDMPSA